MTISSFGVALSHHLHLLNDVLLESTFRPIILIFINGLMLPQSMWSPTLEILKSSFAASPQSVPVYAVTYDRYGQGESVPKEQLDWKPEPHDMLSAVDELSRVMSSLRAEYSFPLGLWPIIIFIAHSIGVPLVRLHAQRPTKQVHARLFLDSNIANSDFVSLLPDPDEESFDASALPDDTTVADLRHMRQRMKGMFHPSIPNSEGLDRRDLARQLPDADRPRIHGKIGPHGKSPFLTVVAHDPIAFAEEGMSLNNTPIGLNERYMQPAWDEYNAGLLKLGAPDRRKGCGDCERSRTLHST